MRTDLLLTVLATSAGILVTWGCNSARVEDPPLLDLGPNLQALVLDYPHGQFVAGAKIDVACLDTGNQGSHETGEGCDCLHLHSGSGIRIGRQQVQTPDMAPGECGHGCLIVTSSASLDLNCGGLDVTDPNHPRKGLCLQAPCG